MAADMETTNSMGAEETGDSRFQTDNSVSRKQQPRQQLSKAMEHMRFAVTVDPIPHTSTPNTSESAPETSSQNPTQTSPPQPTAEPTENDAYGVPASLQPNRLPPSRSHDPTNNQKRSDPFTFGSRYLEEGDNIFDFNAWDHVTVDDSYLAFSESQYSAQRASPVNDFDRQRYNAQPEKWWNQFYKNNKTNFFKNRKWLAQEFPILEELGREDGPAATLLEVGAGAGNSAFPILERSRNPRLKIHACDFSKKAVELIRSHELYDDGKRIQADVWDVASPPTFDNAGLPSGLTENSVDVVLMIFIFSALAPEQWDQAVRNIWRVLKPGGQVLFRDYGRGDLAQVRFKKGRYMEENFYVRGDGTRVYFFEQSELEDIWAGGAAAKKRMESVQVGNVADTKVVGEEVKEEIEQKMEGLGLRDPDVVGEEKEGGMVCDVNDLDAPRPAFQVAHIGVDRRMLVNRQRRLKMYRCWMQAVFRKAGQESEVPTSTLRQEKEEEGEVGEEQQEQEQSTAQVA
ncbi:Methyltransf-12 multi-domain protein [Pyrenophora tritici-repentis]|nr:Methyltransf-12 multi-domain protein [Pyrenophora tritici-repentis]KAI0610559.1 Methyltransf-12 multi-domain protein [Pyrenophora tritici-repentis]